MDRYALDLVTHRHVEALLGGGGRGQQQRRRLIARGLLADVPLFRADRAQLAIYPEFQLAALVVRGHVPDDARDALAVAARMTRPLYETDAYKALAAALAAALNEIGSYEVNELVRVVAVNDRDLLESWRSEVRTVEDEVRDAVAIFVDSAPGLVVGSVSTTAGVRYEVEVGGVIESHLGAEAPAHLEPGTEVLRDRVHLGSVTGNFLLPASREALIVPDTDTMSDEEAEVAYMHSLLDDLDVPLRQIPQLGAGRLAIENGVTVKDDLGIDIPWDLLAGASTMSRARSRG